MGEHMGGSFYIFTAKYSFFLFVFYLIINVHVLFDWRPASYLCGGRSVFCISSLDHVKVQRGCRL